jgi:hypothetical protein
MYNIKIKQQKYIYPCYGTGQCTLAPSVFWVSEAGREVSTEIRSHLLASLLFYRISRNYKFKSYLGAEGRNVGAANILTN